MTADMRPAPMTPLDCDLRGYKYMPLHGARLFSSEFDALASDTEFRAELNIFWAAYQQVPAASLPNDDAFLCKAAGLGRDQKKWSKIKQTCLRKWVECSDGRLYHAFLADVAIEAFEGRLAHDKKRETDRQRLKAWRRENAERIKAQQANNETEWGQDETPHETCFNEDAEIERSAGGQQVSTLTFGKTAADHHQGTRGADHERSTDCLDIAAHETRLETQGETRFVAGISLSVSSKEDTVLRTGASPPPPADARATLWKQGVPLVRQLLGKSDDASRKLLGRFLRDARDDCPRVLAALQQAADLRPADPAAWITAALQNRRQTRADESRAKLAEFIAGIDKDRERPSQPQPELLR